MSCALQNLACAGQHIVAEKTLYGGTYNLLAHTLTAWGIRASFVDPQQPGAFEKAIRPETRAVFIESLGNPHSNLVDIEAVARLAHAHGIPLVIDNTFATPYLLRPLEYGADIVVHSATKFIGGHGAALGGVIVDGGRFDWAASGKFPQFSEPDPSYHGLSFVQAGGPAAFALRARPCCCATWAQRSRLCTPFFSCKAWRPFLCAWSAMCTMPWRVVEFLQSHPRVEKVNHPSLPESPDHHMYKKYFPQGGGSIFTVEIKGGAREARRLH